MGALGAYGQMGGGWQRDPKCWCRTRGWEWLAPQGTADGSRDVVLGQGSTSSSVLSGGELVPALGSLPACLGSRDALRPCRDPTPNPEAALAPLACRDAGELYGPSLLLDPLASQMLLVRVPLPHPRSHSTDVPQVVAERGHTHPHGYDFARKS